MKGLARHRGADRTVQLAVLKAKSVPCSQDNMDHGALSRLYLVGSKYLAATSGAAPGPFAFGLPLPCDGNTEEPRATDILQGSYFRGYGAPLGVDQGSA